MQQHDPQDRFTVGRWAGLSFTYMLQQQTPGEPHGNLRGNVRHVIFSFSGDWGTLRRLFWAPRITLQCYNPGDHVAPFSLPTPSSGKDNRTLFINPILITLTQPPSPWII